MTKSRLLLTDVTAMSGEAVCIAGVDLASRTTLRLNEPQPTRSFVARHGGLKPGDVIEVEVWPLTGARAPHVEDCRWDPASVKKLESLSTAEFLAIQTEDAFNSIEDAFGEPTVKAQNGNHGWADGTGKRSLATVRVRYVRHELDIRRHEEQDRIPVKTRGFLRDDGNRYWGNIPFQDLVVRTHLATCDSCVARPLVTLRADFEANRAIVRVGLTRAYPPGDSSACWLQITNVLARPREHF